MSELSPRSRVLSELEQIRARVKDLVTSNTYSAAAEKLDLTEFCLDGIPLQNRAQAIDAAADKIVSEAEEHKKTLEAQWQRLKAERWDQNKVQQQELTDFTVSASVFSYPVRKANPNERAAKHVLFWRAVNSHFETSEAALAASIPFEYRDESLLPSTALVTPRLRRMQSFLVASLTENLRTSFNGVFAEAGKRRAQLADQISVHQDRLRKISSELKDESVVQACQVKIALPLSALEVDEASLVSAVVFSEQELKEQEATRQRESARRAKFEGSEMMRALQEMMGGKVKSKRELSPLETEISREAFFDDPLRPQSGWTEDENRQYAEYEKKCRDLEIVRDKYRAELRVEVGKIAEEVEKIVTTWKSELEILAAKRASCDKDILGLELYVVRLHMMEISRTNQLQRLQSLQTQLDVAAAKTAELREFSDERSAQIVETRNELENLFQQEKSNILATKSFLRKAGLPATLVGPLMKSFKSPHPISDRPKEVEDSAVWADFCDLKDERTSVLASIAEKQESLNTVTEELRALQVELAVAEETERQIERQISNMQGEIDHTEFNVPVVLHLTSGDNEVPFGVVVTDYSKAVLLDVTAAVLPRNKRIRELADLKQEVLNDIAAFSKKLKAKDFDLEKLNLQIEDLKETMKDVHLAKVTRDLKTLLTEDSKAKKDKQVAVLGEVKAHVAQAGEEKQRQLERFLSQVDKSIAKKEQENELIIERIRAMQTTATNASLSASDASASVTLDAKTKFKGERKPVIAGGGKIAEDVEEVREAHKAFRTVRSKAELLTLVKKHNAEIERLRRALDKFRQRTFPSFASNKELGFTRTPADIR